MLSIVSHCWKLWTYATLIGGKFIWVSGATVVGWWFAQSNLQSKQHFDCNWLTGNFEERRMLFWTSHLQSMPSYLQLFWTSCWFLFICPRVVSVTKVIFWNSRDIFGRECPSFGHWWLPTRIPRVFGFWTNCTYSAPRGGATKMKTWTNFLLIKGSGETLLWIVPEGKSSCLNLKLKEFKEFVDSFQICLDSSDECLRFNSKVFLPNTSLAMRIEKLATCETTYLVKGVIDSFDHLGDVLVGVFQLELVLLPLERVVKVLEH